MTNFFSLPNSWLALSPLHDDRVAYETAVSECERQARIAAFGAIRHAAEVARSHDQHWIDPDEHAVIAQEIRRAIRVAIGSPKA